MEAQDGFPPLLHAGPGHWLDVLCVVWHAFVHSGVDFRRTLAVLELETAT